MLGTSLALGISLTIAMTDPFPRAIRDIPKGPSLAHDRYTSLTFLLAQLSVQVFSATGGLLGLGLAGQLQKLLVPV